MLSDFKEKKETFLAVKNGIFESPKNRIFSKGLTHAFEQKCYLFGLIRFAQNKTRNNT